jgi:5-methylcytosine-specific restriction endonuclease McrBC GTP-binding regulatory subunit McrB
MTTNKLKLQQFRTNDLVNDSGKQIEFGKSWNDSFFEIDETIASVVIPLTFKALSTTEQHIDGASIELKLAEVTNRGDRKAYANGSGGMAQLKDFFINKLGLSTPANLSDFFAIYKKSDAEYYLYYVPKFLYDNFIKLFQATGTDVTVEKRKLPNPKNDKYIKLLDSKKNLVLTGAPGTGKTYIAKQVAASIVSDGSADWSGLSADQREQVGFVQFHPSFDYTDFVEGLRPDKDGNFSRQDGIFKEFCKKAINNPEDKFVFIIDEINRGELSKIFGELFYSIEPDYRGLEGRVKTQYINMVEDDDEFKEGFYIPENVYIIGTMNDVDRGVEAMDFAIRRRFAWKAVTAEESAANMGITGTALAKMNKINEVIKEKLGQAYCIGGAYFRKLDGGNFADLWDNHLSGIVTEYFRGEPEADARIAEIKAAYDAAEEKKEESNLASAPAETETTPAAE